MNRSRSLKKHPFCTLPALGASFNPRHTHCIHLIKIIARLASRAKPLLRRLGLKQNLDFSKGLGSGLMLMCICLLAGCSGLPALQPVTAGTDAALPAACRAIFPQGKWQFTHTIAATFPGGGEKLLLGATAVDALHRSVDCALMTVEGFVLFQAHMGKRLHVARAVPPFDRKGFAAGMLADIQLMFLEPAADRIQTGWPGGPSAPEDGPVCRYTGEAGLITDVKPGAGWQIDRYTARGNLTRTVTADPGDGPAGFPGRLRLRATGPAGYTLEMKLIDAVRVTD